MSNTYTLLKINADDTESEIATELALSTAEALMVLGSKIGRKSELCEYGDHEFFLKSLNAGRYEREPVRYALNGR